MNDYTSQYLATTVNSASREQLMLMLYDGAIRFLALGVQAVEQGSIDKRVYYINKASAIITEFMVTLDYKQNDQLANNLAALYTYMLKQLLKANLKNDQAPLLEVKNLLSDLRNTWAQAIEINKQEIRDAAGGIPSENNNQAYQPLSVAL